MIVRNLLTVLFLFLGFSFCNSQGSTYTKAEKAFQNKQFNKAKEFFQKITDLKNVNPKIKIDVERRLNRDFSE